MVNHVLVFLTWIDKIIECQTGIALFQADSIFRFRRKQRKKHGVQRRSHVNNDIIVCAMNRLPYLPDIFKGVAPHAIREGNNIVDGRMAIEKRTYFLVQDKINSTVWEGGL